MENIENYSNSYDALKKTFEEESKFLVRDLQIRILGTEDSVTRKGRPIRYAVWEYFDPLSSEWGWKTRKTPLNCKETQLLINSGPYEENTLYRVTAEREDSGFFCWTKIEPINNPSSEINGEHE